MKVKLWTIRLDRAWNQEKDYKENEIPKMYTEAFLYEQYTWKKISPVSPIPKNKKNS